MTSEMEQALDEILSGVNALLEKSPAAAIAQGRPAARGGLAERAVDAPSPESLRIGAQQVPSLLSILAMAESDPMHPASALAGRCIQQLLVARGVSLGEIGQDFPSVLVSPIMMNPLRGLAKTGAVLVECDAHAGTWDMSMADLPRARVAMQRLRAAVCPDQRGEKSCWKIPHFPERLRLRWSNEQNALRTNQSVRLGEFAVIDQDNLAIKPTTIFWMGGLWFVPDWYCAMAYHAGGWRPVIDPNPDGVIDS